MTKIGTDAEKVAQQADDYVIRFVNENDVRFATDSKQYRALARAFVTTITTAQRELAKKIFEGLQSTQEKVVTRGGRDARSAEMRRRQSIYIRGLDDARGAVFDVCKTEGIDIDPFAIREAKESE